MTVKRDIIIRSTDDISVLILTFPSSRAFSSLRWVGSSVFSCSELCPAMMYLIHQIQYHSRCIRFFHISADVLGSEGEIIHNNGKHFHLPEGWVAGQWLLTVAGFYPSYESPGCIGFGVSPLL
jgi:hypothetical protein